MTLSLPWGPKICIAQHVLAQAEDYPVGSVAIVSECVAPPRGSSRTSAPGLRGRLPWVEAATPAASEDQWRGSWAYLSSPRTSGGWGQRGSQKWQVLF
ncbi:unnamed protein product [Rangifer tarandus platyrhynchus]|uniref:Uncharacterized protein n=1 Tax=Rangifer tarandus platyrhynchus TaxID=3082113 RepID=A0AC59Y0E8_RANTA